MKKIKRWIAVCCLLFAATLIPVDAQEAFIIDDLHVSMEVHEDGGIDITETYVLNFTEAKHGFFRNIPTSYDMEWSVDGKLEKKSYYFPVSEVTCNRTCSLEGNADAVVVKLKDVSSNEGQKVYESEGNTIYLSDVEEETDAYLIYFEASGEFSTQGGSIVSVVSHDIEKKHKAYELEGSVNVILDSGMQELPWMYLSVNKTKNKDECGFRLSKALVAGQSSVKLQLKDLVKTTWTHK